MKALIDTNVIMDVIMVREPHYRASSDILELCGKRIKGIMTVNQTSDICYLLRREKQSIATVKTVLRKLFANLKLIDATVGDAKNALSSGMSDYEDALLAYAAKRQKADYIVTRNEKDFAGSPVEAVSPAAFLEKLYAL